MVGRVLRLRARVGDHNRHRLADVAHRVLRDHRLEKGHDRIDGVLAHRNLRQPPERSLHLGCGDDGADAGHGFGAVEIHSLQTPMRHRTAHDCGVQHAFALQIGDVLPLASQQALVLDPLHRLADPGARPCARNGHGRRLTTTSL